MSEKMIIAEDLGGIHFYGFDRMPESFYGIPIEFDSDFFYPQRNKRQIVFPCWRGQMDYEVHRLAGRDNGDFRLLVIKDHRVFVFEEENIEVYAFERI